MAVVLNQGACRMCGSCLDVCPAGALLRREKTIEIVAEFCLECGECISECPNDALRFST
jgi:NAD-dependent dihydropyrimidine dehydrogenase PreA subunit